MNDFDVAFYFQRFGLCRGDLMIAIFLLFQLQCIRTSLITTKVSSLGEVVYEVTLKRNVWEKVLEASKL